MAHYEICSRLKSKNWVRHRDNAGSPYMVLGDQWVGYEDQDSVIRKVAHFSNIHKLFIDHTHLNKIRGDMSGYNFINIIY